MDRLVIDYKRSLIISSEQRSGTECSTQNNFQVSFLNFPPQLTQINNNNSNSNSPVQEEGCKDIVGQCKTIFDLLTKFLKLDPLNPKLNKDYFNLLIEFASVPFGDSVINERSTKISSHCVHKIVDIISCETVIVQNPEMVDLTYLWAQKFLVSFHQIDKHSSFLKNIIDFFDVFMPVYLNRYLLRPPHNCDFFSATSPEQSLTSLTTVLKFYTEFCDHTKEYQVHMDIPTIVGNISSSFLRSYIDKIFFPSQQDHPTFEKHEEDTLKQIKRKIEEFIPYLPTSIAQSIVNLFQLEINKIKNVFCSLRDKYSKTPNSRNNLTSQDKNKISSAWDDFWMISRFLIGIYKGIESPTIEITNLMPFEVITSCLGFLEVLLIESDVPFKDTFIDEYLSKLSNHFFKIMNHAVQVISLLQQLDDSQLYTLQTTKPALVMNIINVLQVVFNRAIGIVMYKRDYATAASMVIATICDSFSMEILSKTFNIFEYLDYVKARTLLTRNPNQAAYISLSGLSLVLNPEFKTIYPQQNLDISQVFATLFDEYRKTFIQLSDQLACSPILEPNDEMRKVAVSYQRECKIISDIILKIHEKGPSVKKLTYAAFSEIFSITLSHLEYFLLSQKILRPTLDLIETFMTTYIDLMNSAPETMICAYSKFLNNFNCLTQISHSTKIEICLAILRSCLFINSRTISKKQILEVVKFTRNFLVPLMQISDRNVVFESFKLAKNIITKQFYFFKDSRSPEIRECFHNLFNILLQNLTAEHIKILRSLLKILNDLDEKGNIYSDDIFKENELIHKLVFKFFSILCTDVFSTVSDDAINNLYRIASKNFGVFYTQIFPYILKNTPSISNDSIQYVLNNLSRAEDHPTFRVQFLNISKDIKYFTMINNQVNSITARV
ncbi:Exportin-6 [Thelohanellus kitauei]|uniref:Exportin-6 n=1 Tax=Thelohanellus kitauei TaxID=669202 RepID=A0A0C2J4I2_THEKT|nr:Exportin-6 [Thelohanellus kitauei]